MAAVLYGALGLILTLIWWVAIVRKHGAYKVIPTYARAIGWCLLAISVGSIIVAPFAKFERVVEHLSSSGE